MKAYVVVHPNDPSKFVVEQHNKVPKNLFCEAPKDEQGEYVLDAAILTVKQMWYNEEASLELEVDQDTPEEAPKYWKAFVDEALISSRDSAMLQQSRNNKLSLLRSLRESKLREVDVMVNELTLGLRSDSTAIKTYRQALMQITDSYKYATDPDKGKAALDSFADDMSDFSGWPTKPS